MQKLSLRDVYPPALYEPIRADMRRRVIELKRPRRIPLGPDVTVVFENRATMIFQVCEMLRAEHISEPHKIEEEIAVYNSLLPDPGELSATLFVEITRSEDIRPSLHRLLGIDEHVALMVGSHRVPALFEAGRSDEDKISSVQYLRFRPDEEARRALGTEGTEVALVCDHPTYSHHTPLSEATRKSLAGDLA